MEPDEVRSPNPAALLAAIETERRRIRRRVTADPAVINATWAVAWFIGFGVAYLAHGPDRVLPGWLGPTVPSVLIVAAFLASTGYAVRADAGITGPSRTSRAMYGASWSLGFGCLTVVNIALVHRGMVGDLAILVWSASSLLLAGVLQLAGGTLWRDRVLFATGAWTMISATGAVLAGVPGNFLVLSLAGGGGFALLAAWSVRCRRP
jgi:hypothetical protein